MPKIYIVGLTVILFSCNNTVGTKPNERKSLISIKETFPAKELLIDKGNEQGSGANIRLSFTESSPRDIGVLYKINSTYKNKVIGFEILVPNPGLSKLIIKSTGVSSDNFIHVFSKLYKQQIDTSAKLTDIITVDCMNMGDYIDSLNKQSDGNYTSTKSQYKLFFQGKEENDYAELYLDVNEKEHWIELGEKDEEYRPILIKLLTYK